MADWKRMQELFATREKQTAKQVSDLQREIDQTQKSVDYLAEMAEGAQNRVMDTKKPVSGVLIRNLGGFVAKAQQGQVWGEERNKQLKTQQSALLNQFGVFKQQGNRCGDRHKADMLTQEKKSNDIPSTLYTGQPK